MLRNLVLASSLLALVSGLSAQCATTSASNAGGTVTLDLNGSAPMAFGFFLVGDTTGSTPVSLGNFASFTLGLAAPFVAAPAGLTDASGDVSLSFDVPANAPAGTYYAQGLTMAFGVTPGAGLTVDFCVADVASFTL